MMQPNIYQSLVNLLSNILEAYTTAFFIVDSKNRQLNLAAVQSLSKHVPDNVSLPMEQSGILSQVYKSGQIIHLDKLPEVTTELSNTLPFYRAGESHIKGLFAAPVGNSAGVIYVDTKYAWGFSDKQQKWIREIAALIHELFQREECLRQQESYTRILDFFYRLDRVALQGCALEEYCQCVVNECAQLLGVDYGFLAFRDGTAANYRLLAATPKTPPNLLNQSFLIKRGLIGWAFENQKTLLIPRLNPEAADHFLFISGEALPHAGTLWGLPVRMSLGHSIVMAFLSAHTREWDKEEQFAVKHLYHFLHLLLEQFYFKEECDLLQSYDLSSGLLNAYAFEAKVEDTVTVAMRNSTPFTLALVQFEPWQILFTRTPPARVREWQEEVAAALCEALPADVVIGQMAENRFALLLPESTRSKIKQFGTLCASLSQQIFTKRAKRVRIHPYFSSVDFPQDGTRGEELWPALYRRLFAAFQERSSKA